MATVTLTGAQTTAFFTNGPQMALTPEQRNRLATEGLNVVDDFEDFKEDQIEQAIKNLRTPIPGIAAVTDAVGNVVTAAVPGIPPCLISARCALRLKVTSIAFHYYKEIGRDVTHQNMDYTNVLRGFYTEWEALLKLSTETKPDVPVLSKYQTPIKWIESFKDCLSRTFGVRNCPIIYVIRPEETVPPQASEPLITNRAYSSTTNSVPEELIR